MIPEPPYVLDGVRCEPFHFDVPLDHDEPGGETIRVFARALRRDAAATADLPWLLYLQGGPGFGAPRPGGDAGWIKRALAEFRVLLLDQRGTGRSSPVNAESLAHLPPAAQARRLALFRADAIVRDAERIRHELSPDRPWSLLGQSYGGFCAFTYLSLFPDALREVFLTGGVPPVGRPAEAIYRATCRRVAEKAAAFFARFPGARELAGRIAAHLVKRDVRLPNGQRFTVEQLQALGIELGFSDGPAALFHLLEGAFAGDRLDPAFLHQALAKQPFHAHPIYAILHEAIYAEGEATNWAAERVRAEDPGLAWTPGTPFAFTGEMVFPWMFEQFPSLAPLGEAAHLLAAKADWGALYDPARLAANTVPLACAVYADDMYVDFDLSRETLARTGCARAFITNEYEHNGLRADGERLLDRLIKLNRDR